MPGKRQGSSKRLKSDRNDPGLDQSDGEEATRRSIKNWLARKRSTEEAAKAVRDGAATDGTSQPSRGSRGGAKAAVPCIAPPPRVHIEVPEIDWNDPPEKPPRYLGREGAHLAKMCVSNNTRSKTATRNFLWDLGYDIRYIIFRMLFVHDAPLVMTQEMLGFGTQRGNLFYVASQQGGIGREPLVLQPPKRRIRFGEDAPRAGPYAFGPQQRALMRSAKWLYIECARIFYMQNSFRIFVDFHDDLNDPIGRLSVMFVYGVRRLALDIVVQDMGKIQASPPLQLLSSWMTQMELNGFRVPIPYHIKEYLPPLERDLGPGNDFPGVDNWVPEWDAGRPLVERTITISPAYPFIKTLSAPHWGPIIRRLRVFRAELNVLSLNMLDGPDSTELWISTGHADRIRLRQEREFMKPIDAMFDMFRYYVRHTANFKFRLIVPHDDFVLSGNYWVRSWPEDPPRTGQFFADKILDYFAMTLRRPTTELPDPAPPAIPTHG
ncbi:hypothetical protein QBC42DRAFT_249027 [Cladorrhinum samala]|uniref:Uncharacterized protein n=1 Tax=Cladorrhinum samala TaxID=585594 RepID=A0AAV9HX94_9PEZI|nr:hypothetical protein QBC42DRAFT_249027 [Cladorrhinum samala]